MALSRAEARVPDRIRVLTGTEILARQREPPPPRAVEQQTPMRYGGGNSPVRHEVVISPDDWGKLAVWQKEGFLAAGDSPTDGQIYGRQNGMWVPVTGVGPSTAVQWDHPAVSWDQPGVLWDQISRARANGGQVGELWDQIARLGRVIAGLQAELAALRKG